MIVAVGTDKLVLYNLSGGRLRQQEKQFSAKNCLDIKFSNGGHLFAAVNRNDVDVYNFYTHECPESMKFSQNHNKSINCIDWYDNDMGFTSCGADGYIYFVDLYTGRLGEKRNMQHSHNEKNAQYLSVANVPGSRYDVLAVGTDRKLTSNRPEKHEKSTKMNDLEAYLSSIVIMKSGRCAITGVGEPGRPGEL